MDGPVDAPQGLGGTVSGPGRNIEIKARCRDLEAAAARAIALGARDAGVLQQRDTFFATTRGRLKLREFGDGRAELISYERPDVAAARASDYVIAPLEDPAAARAVRAALERALGVVRVVVKTRRLFLHASTRIHLDTVEGLGTFVELETVIGAQSDDEAHAELRALATALGIRDDDRVAVPYTELSAETAIR